MVKPPGHAWGRDIDNDPLVEQSRRQGGSGIERRIQRDRLTCGLGEGSICQQCCDEHERARRQLQPTHILTGAKDQQPAKARCLACVIHRLVPRQRLARKHSVANAVDGEAGDERGARRMQTHNRPRERRSVELRQPFTGDRRRVRRVHRRIERPIQPCQIGEVGPGGEWWQLGKKRRKSGPVGGETGLRRWLGEDESSC
ncbi:hypothetical protein [Defluviicoccus vanus]|uniref:Uncharacterized protein n=1 Tax=Defluviicoccus vanus TaxID=111831 RepID=A0A7H1MXI3_9PROT|nr:hypothetical protein [Defluviicoccus vanus]QNT68169.1 hypothetical protein HQ394_00805 [Defluviicoccus vanus]